MCVRCLSCHMHMNAGVTGALYPHIIGIKCAITTRHVPQHIVYRASTSIILILLNYIHISWSSSSTYDVYGNKDSLKLQ